MLQLAQACDVPVSAYLRDQSDHRVGAGALILAAGCARAVIDPDTAIRAEPSDGLANLVSETADLEDAARRLNGALTTALAPRGAPEGLADLLANFSDDTVATWAIFAGPATTLVTDEPRPTSATVIKVVARPSAGPPQLTLDAPTTEKLGLVTALASSEPAALRSLGISGSPRAKILLEGGVERQRDAISRSLEEADAAIEHAKTALDLPDPPHASTSPDLYRRAAAAAQQSLTAAGAAITACEKRLEDFPELLQLPAPGQTSAASARTRHATKWRTTLQSRRDKLAKLVSRSELFRTQ